MRFVAKTGKEYLQPGDGEIIPVFRDQDEVVELGRRPDDGIWQGNIPVLFHSG